MRGTLAFISILSGVALSATGSTFASSLATMFPAIFLSTMVGLWISHEVFPSIILQSDITSSSASRCFGHRATFSTFFRQQFPVAPLGQSCSDRYPFHG
jgi:hypothetical protein